MWSIDYHGWTVFECYFKFVEINFRVVSYLEKVKVILLLYKYN